MSVFSLFLKLRGPHTSHRVTSHTHHATGLEEAVEARVSGVAAQVGDLTAGQLGQRWPEPSIKYGKHSQP